MSGIGHIVLTTFSSALPAPTYSISNFSMDEGVTSNRTLTTTNVVDGTTLYWTISHITTAAADFSSTSGSFTVTSNSGTVSITTVADSSTEGSQTFTLQIRTGSTSGTIVATATGTINDTSVASDTIAGFLSTSLSAYNAAAQNDLVPITAAEYAALGNMPGTQGTSGMKDSAFQYSNTISPYGGPVGPIRVTAWKTTYWWPLTAGYIYAVKIKAFEDAGLTATNPGIQLGYGTTTNGAGVALTNKLANVAITIPSDKFLYFTVKQPSANITAGVYQTSITSGIYISGVGDVFSSPPDNSGTMWYWASGNANTPITQTLNTSVSHSLPCISWQTTITRPW